MKSILKISAALLLAAPVFTGCIKETFPKGGTPTAGQVASNEAATKALIAALPASMVTAGTVRPADQTDFGIASIGLRTDFMCGDIAVMGDNATYCHFSGYARNQFQDSRYVMPAYFWQAYYQWIEGANKVIRLISPEAEGDMKAALGHAYAFRAKYYLDLARLFEPKAPHAEDVDGTYDISNVKGLTVPIVKESTTEAEAKNNPRASHKDMYDFILSDLKMAETLLAEYAPKRGMMPSLGVVYGLCARAYLEVGAGGDAAGYTKAAEYARKAIEVSGCTPMTQQQWEDPATAFNNADANNSWIWSLPVTASQLGNLHNMFAHFCSEAVWGYADYHYAMIGIDRALYESINENDFRKHAFLDPKKWDYYNYKINGDAQDYMANTKPYASLKFRPCNGETQEWTIGALNDYPLMRVEEMYFIEMEAVAQTDLAKAKSLLETYMNSYRMINGATYSCKAANLEDFHKEMMLQKRIEFFGEGIVMYDLKRLDIGFVRGYKGTNQPTIFALNCPNGRSPQWNIVITRAEFQNNTAITDQLNNPDPSGKLRQWDGR